MSRGLMPIRTRVVSYGVDLGLGDEVARVDEAEPVDLARVLGRGRADERDERVVVVAR